MKGKREISEKSILVIHMKPDVRYERLIDTLSVARETGISKVSLKKAGL